MPSSSRLPPAAARAVLLLVLGGALRAGAAQPADAGPLTLERAVALALTRNERARAAQGRQEAASARLAQARAAFWPELSAAGSYTRRLYETVREVGGQTVVIQRADALQSTATVGLTLLDPTLFPLLQQASKQATAARHDATQERLVLAFEAATAFVQALSLEQVREAAARRLDLARRVLQDAKARFEARLVSRNDVTRASLEQATAERELTRAQGNAQLSLLDLGYLVNASLSPPLAPPRELEQALAAPRTDGTVLAREALSRRVDVASLRQQTEAQRAFAQEPPWRFLPALTLVGQLRATNETGLSGRNVDGLLSLNLSWALLDARRFAEASERWALVEVALATQQARERAVGVEVERALVDLTSAHASVRQAEEGARAARQNADETVELYRQGLARALDAADANVQLFEADVALARERYAQTIAYLNLRAAVGLDPLGREPTP